TVPMNHLVTVLGSSADKGGRLEDPTVTEGKIFISFTGDADSTLSSENIRGLMLDQAVALWNEQNPNKRINLTEAQKAEFRTTNMFGCSFTDLPALLSMSVTERDKFLGDLTDQRVGIPINGNKDRRGHLNDFQIWLQAIYDVAQRINTEQAQGLSDEERLNLNNLYIALMRKGQGIAIKADKDTPFTTVQQVFDNLQTMKLNKFSLMTALKSEDEPTQ
ncbi:MAG: biopolymer transporter ExbD, partial [Muribaculaceae bacterium]